jgi:excisionase family DNA binding protein
MAQIPTFDQLPSAVSELKDDVIWIKNFLQHNNSSGMDSHVSEKFLTVPEAAEFLGLANQTVYGLISRKLIPCMKRQKRVYFSKAELTRWLEDGRRLTRDEIAVSSRPVHIKKGSSR